MVNVNRRRVGPIKWAFFTSLILAGFFVVLLVFSGSILFAEQSPGKQLETRDRMLVDDLRRDLQELGKTLAKTGLPQITGSIEDFEKERAGLPWYNFKRKIQLNYILEQLTAIRDAWLALEKTIDTAFRQLDKIEKNGEFTPTDKQTLAVLISDSIKQNQLALAAADDLYERSRQSCKEALEKAPEKRTEDDLKSLAAMNQARRLKSAIEDYIKLLKSRAADLESAVSKPLPLQPSFPPIKPVKPVEPAESLDKPALEELFESVLGATGRPAAEMINQPLWDMLFRNARIVPDELSQKLSRADQISLAILNAYLMGFGKTTPPELENLRQQIEKIVKMQEIIDAHPGTGLSIGLFWLMTGQWEKAPLLNSGDLAGGLEALKLSLERAWIEQALLSRLLNQIRERGNAITVREAEEMKWRLQQMESSLKLASENLRALNEELARREGAVRDLERQFEKTLEALKKAGKYQDELSQFYGQASHLQDAAERLRMYLEGLKFWRELIENQKTETEVPADVLENWKRSWENTSGQTRIIYH